MTVAVEAQGAAAVKGRSAALCEEMGQRLTSVTRALERCADLATGTGRSASSVTATAAGLAVRLHDVERRAESLERALVTSRRIGIALGIVMRERLCTEDQAFALLREKSMHTNTKLRDVAELVILTGRL